MIVIGMVVTRMVVIGMVFTSIVVTGMIFTGLVVTGMVVTGMIVIGMVATDMVVTGMVVTGMVVTAGQVVTDMVYGCPYYGCYQEFRNYIIHIPTSVGSNQGSLRTKSTLCLNICEMSL
jgi:hypothetical protein